MSNLVYFLFIMAFPVEVFLNNFRAPENIAFDNQSRMMYVSDIKGLYRVKGKEVRQIYKGTVNGIAVEGGKIYFAPVTSVMIYDKGGFSTFATGFRMANGLAICGDKLVVSDSGIVDIFLSSVRIYDLKAKKLLYENKKVLGANGIACDGDKGFYFTQTFIGTIYYTELKPPYKSRKVFSYAGKPPIIDDLALGKDGYLYVADFLHGKILKVNPATGKYTVFLRGLHNPTTIRFSTIPQFGQNCAYIAEKGPPAFLGRTIVRYCPEN